MENCRRCGKLADPIWFGKCRACHHIEMHASSLAGMLLILLAGCVIAFLTVPLFFTTMPPWHGPGNEFAPFFYIMSIGGFFIGPVMFIGSYFGVRKARDVFRSRLESIGIEQEEIRCLDRQALKIGFSYMLILIGGVSVSSSLLMIAILVMVLTSAAGLLFVFTCFLVICLGPVALGLFIQEWGWKTANAITKLYS